MQHITSIKNNEIIFSPETKDKSISEILTARFENPEHIERGMDDLYDPYLLTDMDKAVNRIKIAAEKKQKVIIFGDYDVDGVTSTSLLVHILTKLGIPTSYRLPHRVHD